MYLIILLFVFFIMAYILIVTESTEKTPAKSEEEQEEDLIDSALVHIVHRKKYYVSVNDKLNTLNLDIPRNAEVFKLTKKKDTDRIALESMTCKGMIMINCTAFYNKTYDINLKGQTLDNMAVQLKLKRNMKNKNYYLKFYNNYYLCTDKNGYLFAGKEKKDIMYFKLESAKEKSAENTENN